MRKIKKMSVIFSYNIADFFLNFANSLERVFLA